MGNRVSTGYFVSTDGLPPSPILDSAIRMADLTPHVVLRDEQVNYLAGVSLSMGMLTKTDLTGIDLAAELLRLLKVNTSAVYNGMPVLNIVGFGTWDPNITAKGAEDVLSLFPHMPTDVAGRFGPLWITFAAVSGFMMLLRFYTRLHLGGGLKKDDAVLLIAWLLGTAFVTVEVLSFYRHSLSIHSWNLVWTNSTSHWEWSTYGIMLFFASSAFYKTALILFYIDLSPSKAYRFVGWFLCAFVWVYTLVCELAYGLSCKPFNAWDDPLNSVCFTYQKQLALMYTLYTFDLVTDLAVLALPLSVIYGLQLRSKKKVLVYILICLGCIVCICSAARLSLVKPYLNNNDQTTNTLVMCTWTLLEVHLGIVCASAPMLRRLVIHIFPKVKATVSQLSKSKHSTTTANSEGIREIRRNTKPKLYPSFPTSLRGGDTELDATIAATTFTDNKSSCDEKISEYDSGSRGKRGSMGFVNMLKTKGMKVTTITQTEERTVSDEDIQRPQSGKVASPTSTRIASPGLDNEIRPFTPQVDEEQGRVRSSRIENGRIVNVLRQESRSSRNSGSLNGSRHSSRHIEAERERVDDAVETGPMELPAEDEEPVRYHYSFESMRVVRVGGEGQHSRTNSRTNSRSGTAVTTGNRSRSNSRLAQIE